MQTLTQNAYVIRLLSLKGPAPLPRTPGTDKFQGLRVCEFLLCCVCVHIGIMTPEIMGSEIVFFAGKVAKIKIHTNPLKSIIIYQNPLKRGCPPAAFVSLFLMDVDIF